MAGMIVKTPIGKVEIRSGKTQTSGATVSVEKIEKQFKRIAEKDIIPLERIEQNELQNK